MSTENKTLTGYLEDIIRAHGGSVDDLPDRLLSTYLKRLAEVCDNSDEEINGLINAALERAKASGMFDAKSLVCEVENDVLYVSYNLV